MQLARQLRGAAAYGHSCVPLCFLKNNKHPQAPCSFSWRTMIAMSTTSSASPTAYSTASMYQMSWVMRMQIRRWIYETDGASKKSICKFVCQPQDVVMCQTDIVQGHRLCAQCASMLSSHVSKRKKLYWRTQEHHIVSTQINTGWAPTAHHHSNTDNGACYTNMF